MGPIATTSAGELEGIDGEGVLQFRGVPFAAPPVGDLRFRPPAPVEPWDGVRAATAFGPISLQNPSPMDQMMGITPEAASEDCLYLNVTTPSFDGSRPVLVWIHGGAFIMGSGSFPMYDTSILARRGDCVIVTLNYRLGELGFLHLAHRDDGHPTSGNLGILDQIAALEWVRDNIAGFGGDPRNVTIFGESAGGMSVSTLLVSPLARGLFHRAVAQSGAAHNVASVKHAEEITDDLMAKLGVTTVDELRALPAETLLKTRGEEMTALLEDPDHVITGGAPLLPYQPVGDGVVVPADPIGAVRDGEAAEVPLLIGTTLEEFKMFSLLDPAQLDEETLAKRVSAVVGDSDGFIDAYREAFPGSSTKDLFGEMITDFVFRIPAIRLAEAHLEAGRPVHMYLFSWRSRAFGGMLGACHAIEVPFVFGSLDGPTGTMFLGADADETRPLSEQVQDAWVAFARTGAPGHAGLPEWPAYDTKRRATLEFAEESRLLEDPMGHVRELWTGVR